MLGNRKLWAAHAASKSKAAVSVGRLDDENPQSTILLYDETAAERWIRHSVRKTIYSITSMPGLDDAVEFVALGNDGDVFYLTEGIRTEQIPGAGTGGDESNGQGSMNFIRYANGLLMACGNASQVYYRTDAQPWLQICGERTAGVGRNFFQSVTGSSPSRILACGYSDVEYVGSSAAMEAELERLEREGPMSEYIKLMNEIDEVENFARGRLYAFDGGNWRSIELPNEQYMFDVSLRSALDFVCVGNGGTVVVGNEADQIEDLSAPNLMEKLRAVRVWDGRLHVLGDASIYTFDQQGSVANEIALPDVGTANTFDMVEGAIWYFGYEGFARYQNSAWQIIDMPDNLISEN